MPLLAKLLIVMLLSSLAIYQQPAERWETGQVQGYKYEALVTEKEGDIKRFIMYCPEGKIVANFDGVWWDIVPYGKSEEVYREVRKILIESAP